ncbi:MAG TPA: hypothetical protein VFE51_00570 [Verrucomicrobiae bacterium]|nr:hypothetical protein [Verrucomicrobiae bacterium]
MNSPRVLEAFTGLLLILSSTRLRAADLFPAHEDFRQEVATSFSQTNSLPAGPAGLIFATTNGAIRALFPGHWYEYSGGRWTPYGPRIPAGEFDFEDAAGRWRRVEIPANDVRQLLIGTFTSFVTTATQLFRVDDAEVTRLNWPASAEIHQIAFGDKALHVACSEGLFCWRNGAWAKLGALDAAGRDWAARQVLGVTFDFHGRLWLASKAGVGCRTDNIWRFFEGKDGLPWNDFTQIAPGPNGELWFATHLGAIRFDGKEWHYRQGPLWLPHDDVRQLCVDAEGNAWCATAAGIACLGTRAMSLGRKAEWYEEQIERQIKRTPFGFVAEAPLRKPGDLSTADPQDSDNDGLWTAMYGAGECFAYGATKAPEAKRRARQAFEALRFLQKVTQGCEHSPPRGYVARTIRPSDWPDPNIGRLQSDLAEQKRDKLWKAYEPRWPKSADGKWYWKSDTSSDELDGHYFFYPLYYDLCADSAEERERVREVVRDLTDHLISHDFCLVDHDGKPTRWGVYGPRFLNNDPDWWQERGLKSLSILCYLAVAAHVTGDAKYEEASRLLIDRYGYAHNAMHPKVQQGPGSGNQSDDEMAFMCYYGLLRCSKDENLKGLIRYSFFRYWLNEAPEMNPFFNFAYVAHNRDVTLPGIWGPVSVSPWPGWLDDSMATLYGFPLDRLNWSHHNSHRLDILDLPKIRSSDLDTPDPPHQRGYRVNGKVLPVENRQFNHWNTDPWQLDYGGNGGELAAGTVFLLPYYMGLHHGFIEKPAK